MHMISRPGKHRFRVQTDDGERIHIVHLPEQYDGTTPIPMVMVLHGGGGSARFAYRVHQWPELSNRETCLIVFPEATLEDPARPASIRDNLRLWNDGSQRSAVARRDVHDSAYLATVMDAVQANFAIDPNRVFVTGFSNGASMTFRVGIELADRVTAIAPVAGHLCIKDPRPARPISMLYMIGRADPINPPQGGFVTTPWGTRRNKPPIMDSVMTWVRLVGASEHPRSTRVNNGVERIDYGPGTAGCTVRLYMIDGQGHEWPGAERTLPSVISGPQTDKLNATQVIWNFFRAASDPCGHHDDSGCPRRC